MKRLRNTEERTGRFEKEQDRKAEDGMVEI